jgi:polygalacturonase
MSKTYRVRLPGAVGVLSGAWALALALLVGTSACGESGSQSPGQDGSSGGGSGNGSGGNGSGSSGSGSSGSGSSGSGSSGGTSGSSSGGTDAGSADAPLSSDGETGLGDAGTAEATTGEAAVGDAAPTLTCDVRAYGAKGDGLTPDTAAIQAAIDACAAAGGGTVVLQAGTFLSGMIHVKTNIVLHVDSTATLLGSQAAADYPDTNPPTFNTQRQQARKALVYAESVDNIRIEGGGTINGQGGAGSPWTGAEALRPMAIFTVLSTHVTVQNITIKDSAMWDLVSMEDDYLAISAVTINSPETANRDGIDVVDCHHVTIDHCTITSGDDSICLKSGVRRGVDDVKVTNSTVQSIGANALKLGTGSYGSFTNVTFDTNTVNGASKAAMAVESVDGADVKNIVFSNITFQNVGASLIVVLGDRGPSTRGGWPSNDVHKTGSLDTVRYENIVGSNVKKPWGSLITGTVTGTTNERVKNLFFTNVHITTLGGLTTVPADPPEYTTQYPEVNMFGNLPAFGYFIRHADGVSFTGSTIDVSPSDVRKPIESRDVTALTMQ